MQFTVVNVNKIGYYLLKLNMVKSKTVCCICNKHLQTESDSYILHSEEEGSCPRAEITFIIIFH